MWLSAATVATGAGLVLVTISDRTPELCRNPDAPIELVDCPSSPDWLWGLAVVALGAIAFGIASWMHRSAPKDE